MILCCPLFQSCSLPEGTCYLPRWKNHRNQQSISGEQNKKRSIIVVVCLQFRGGHSIAPQPFAVCDHPCRHKVDTGNWSFFYTKNICLLSVYWRLTICLLDESPGGETLSSAASQPTELRGTLTFLRSFLCVLASTSWSLFLGKNFSW